MEAISVFYQINVQLRTQSFTTAIADTSQNWGYTYLFRVILVTDEKKNITKIYNSLILQISVELKVENLVLLYLCNGTARQFFYWPEGGVCVNHACNKTQ